MRYQAIYKSSIADGEGWRTVLFVSGCSHACVGCHNKGSWNKNVGKEFSNEDLSILIKQIGKKEIRGLTISGGDPLMDYNAEDVCNLCRVVKTIFPNKDIWIYTGYSWEEVRNMPVMKYIDVLVDGKFMVDKRDTTLAFRGSSNQRIIDVKKSLVNGETVLLQY